MKRSPSRLTPYAVLAFLAAGSGLGIGIGLAQAPVGTAAPVVPVPQSWKAVSYHGIELDVPKSWVVTGWHADDACGINTPTVLLGPEPYALMKVMCVARPARFRPAEVNIGSPPPVSIKTRQQTLNGEPVQVAIFDPPRRPIGLVPEVFVYVLPEHLWITMFIGGSKRFPGGAPGRATEILDTIRQN